MTDGLILEGDISDIFLPTFLMSLYKNQETGILTVDAGGYQKAMLIKEGNVVFASSKCPDDRLGESLLRNGKISVKDYIATSRQVRQGKRMGELLVDMGVMLSEEMVQGVKSQLIDIIDSMFSLTRGHYILELTDISTEDLITLSIDMPNLLYEGMKKVKSWKTMYSVVGPLETRIRKADQMPGFFSRLELTSDEEHLLSITNQSMTVDSILESSYLSQFDTYSLIWIFITLGLMQKETSAQKTAGEPRVKDVEEVIEDYNDIFILYYHKLGPDAGEVFGKSYELMLSGFPDIMEGQEGFISYGRLDPDGLLLKFRGSDEGARKACVTSFLCEVFYGLTFFARKKLDENSLREIDDYIQRNSSVQLFPGAQG